jgi:hypothetical protein
MAQLPQGQPLGLMQNQWASQLNPVIANQLVNGNPLTGILLSNGTTTVNHLLGRLPQGFIQTNKNGLGDYYFKNINTLTVQIVANAAITIDLWVF